MSGVPGGAGADGGVVADPAVGPDAADAGAGVPTLQLDTGLPQGADAQAPSAVCNGSAPLSHFELAQHGWRQKLVHSLLYNGAEAADISAVIL